MPAGVPAALAFVFCRLFAVFAFLILKIVIRGLQQVKPVICTCFRFFAYKNDNAGVVTGVSALGAFLSNISLAIFILLIIKIEIWRQ